MCEYFITVYSFLRTHTVESTSVWRGYMCAVKSDVDMSVVCYLHIQYTVHIVCICQNIWNITHLYPYFNTKKGGGSVLEDIHHIPRI